MLYGDPTCPLCKEGIRTLQHFVFYSKTFPEIRAHNTRIYPDRPLQTHRHEYCHFAPEKGNIEKERGKNDHTSNGSEQRKALGRLPASTVPSQDGINTIFSIALSSLIKIPK